MIILRASIFRKIYLTELILCLIILLFPFLLTVWKIASFRFTFMQEQPFSTPGIALITSLRLLLMISLANHLSEASAAVQEFYHAKNWCLMQCVTEAAALLINVLIISLQSRNAFSEEPAFLVLLIGFLIYLLLLQAFDYLAKRYLLRGFRAVWELCGGDAAMLRQFRSTNLLLIASCMLYLPLVMVFPLQNSPYKLLLHAVAGCSVVLIQLVQFRFTRHARKTAELLAALSE